MPEPVEPDWGIEPGYLGVGKVWRDSPQPSIDAVRDSMGTASGHLAGGTGMMFVRAGESPAVELPGLLLTEDGGEVEVTKRFPPDLPLGYHRFEPSGSGEPTTVVVTPGRCRLPDHRMWGWTVQLYSLRSRRSWGIGDLGDLRELARWSATELGAGMVVVNPLHASVPGHPQATSPYYPSSRQFRSPLYLRIEDVPGAEALPGEEMEGLARRGEALNGTQRIDRDAVWNAKFEALEAVWGRIAGNPGADFESWCDAQGSSLERFAAFCVLVENHGRRWHDWAPAYRSPEGSGVVATIDSQPDRVRFHQWLQWLLDRQIAAAGQDLAVVHDLAVGVDPTGADAWLWQEVFAPDMSVGAPPDEFNTQGQDWGVPPFDPWRLRAHGYQPVIETVRAGLAHGGGLRIDHVMGLFRLFWIPAGASPRDGVYVRYQASDLLDIIALESHRSGAFVIGEDLGTVGPGVRDELAARHVLSSRVMWSERSGPATFPAGALATVTTHDLPTVAGMWTGRDLQDQIAAGTDPNREAASALRERIARLLGLDGDEDPGEVVGRAYASLGSASSILLGASVEDALEVKERPNMPGTTDSWPNWSIPLPVSLEELEQSVGARRIAQALSRPPAQEATG